VKQYLSGFPGLLRRIADRLDYRCVKREGEAPDEGPA
jgi:hypothetical protein